MATPKINENCHYVQNDPHKCKIKLEKFHFDILCRFGVIKESLPGGGTRPPGEIGLRLLILNPPLPRWGGGRVEPTRALQNTGGALSYIAR